MTGVRGQGAVHRYRGRDRGLDMGVVAGGHDSGSCRDGVQAGEGPPVGATSDRCGPVASLGAVASRPRVTTPCPVFGLRGCGNPDRPGAAGIGSARRREDRGPRSSERDCIQQFRSSSLPLKQGRGAGLDAREVSERGRRGRRDCARASAAGRRGVPPRPRSGPVDGHRKPPGPRAAHGGGAAIRGTSGRPDSEWPMRRVGIG